MSNYRSLNYTELSSIDIDNFNIIGVFKLTGATGTLPSNLTFPCIFENYDGFQILRNYDKIYNRQKSGASWSSWKELDLNATTFLSLDDTPNSYSGFENHFLKINDSGTGIEFFDNHFLQRLIWKVEKFDNSTELLSYSIDVSTLNSKTFRVIGFYENIFNDMSNGSIISLRLNNDSNPTYNILRNSQYLNLNTNTTFNSGVQSLGLTDFFLSPNIEGDPNQNQLTFGYFEAIFRKTGADIVDLVSNAVGYWYSSSGGVTYETLIWFGHKYNFNDEINSIQIFFTSSKILRNYQIYVYALD